MSYKTLSAITQDVIKNVGLVSGTGVQTYSEPNIKAAIQRMFDMIYRKRFWDHLTDIHTYTLNGVSGLIDTDINDVLKAFEDVEWIFINGTERRVVRPRDREHLRVTGTSPLYYTPLIHTHASFANRVLKFWPITATGSVDIKCRTKPDAFTDEDTVPFPSDIISHAATWDLLDSDGINPTAAAKAQALYDITYQDYITNLGEDAIGHGGRRSNVPLTIRTL